MVALSEIMKLSLDERIRLAEAIWDSVAREAAVEPEALPLSRAQREDLDQRLDEIDHEPGVGLRWVEVKASLLGSAPLD